MLTADALTPDTDGASFAAMRAAMIDSQLRTSDVTEPRLIAAMQRVAREDFVPEAMRPVAYIDRAVPLAGSRALNPPLATGRLLAAAQVQAGERVLLIGAASGYTSALLAEMGAAVVAVESDGALVAMARAALADHVAITLVEAPMHAGAAAHGPYAAIIVDGAIEAVPGDWASQLGAGGRLVTGLLDRGVTRIARGLPSSGGFALVPIADIDCITLPGFAPPPRFTF